jgi:signal transduction histidine kinase
MKAFSRFLTTLFFCSFTGVLLISCSNPQSPAEARQVDIRTRDSLQFYWTVMIDKDHQHFSEARRCAGSAIRLANAKGSISDRALSYMLSGSVYLNHDPDSSYLLNTHALYLARESRKDTILQKIYYNLADLHYSAFNYQEALVLLDSARVRSGAAKDYTTLVNALILIGHIDRDQYNNVQARVNYTKALRIAEEQNMDLQKGVILGNLGSISEPPDSAVILIREAISILSDLETSKAELCYMLMNLANFIPSTDSAIRYYKQAITFAQAENHTELLIAAYNNLGCTYMEMNETALAAQCLFDHAIPLAEKTHNIDWLSTVCESGAELYEKRGDYKNAYHYQKMALKTRIGFLEKQALNQTRLLNALLMAKNRELEIKAKSDEIREKRDQLRLLFISIVAIFLLAMVATFYFLWKIQRKNLRIKTQEVETARRIAFIEEKEDERISMQLHDAVRPLTAGLIREIESTAFPDPSARESLVSKVRDSVKQLRRISHRINPYMRAEMTLGELVHSILEDLESDNRLKVRLSLPEEEPGIGKEAMNQLYFILQELLMNAGKYVKEGEIQLGFEEDFGRLYLFYKDDGPGFIKAEGIHSGLGFMHIMERAKLINGTATVDSEPGKGTTWIVTIPLTGDKKGRS